MGGKEGNNTTTGSCSVASGKRCRDPEDEVYVDNLNSHKRYLSEIMASSMNGLKVGDPLSHNLVESAARDDMSIQYSPMSEDSDDSRNYDSSPNNCGSQTESLPPSPVSPCRYPKNASVFASNLPATSYSTTPPNPRQRNSDSEGSRFPSSPSDICHSADLRRAALLRSVQMRSQFDIPFSSSSTRESAGNNDMESEERCSCSYTKAAAVDEREYRNQPQCEASSHSAKGGNKVIPCSSLDMKAEGDNSSGE